MDWVYPVIIFIGLFDAAAVLIGGLVMSTFVLMGRETGKIMERIMPAGVILIVSTIAASLILLATKWMISP